MLLLLGARQFKTINICTELCNTMLLFPPQISQPTPPSPPCFHGKGKETFLAKMFYVNWKYWILVGVYECQCICVCAHLAYAAVVVGLVRSGIRSRRLPRNPVESQESWSEMDTTLCTAPALTGPHNTYAKWNIDS